MHILFPFYKKNNYRTVLYNVVQRFFGFYGVSVCFNIFSAFFADAIYSYGIFTGNNILEVFQFIIKYFCLHGIEPKLENAVLHLSAEIFKRFVKPRSCSIAFYLIRYYYYHVILLRVKI